jgi:glycosyltransferase involved in cell wall biosynthesis
MIEISIVVPVYNSEGSVAELTQQVQNALASLQFEIILVNDRSLDGSWNEIKRICGNNPNVIGINLKKNVGQDNAIMAGLTVVQGSYTVIMDDDLQHSPVDVIKLWEKCREGFDVCYGYYSQKKQSVWKNVGSAANGYIAEVFLKKPKSLYLSPFKILKSSVVKEIVAYKGPFPYIDGIILTVTSNISQVAISHHKRLNGRGNYGLVRSMSVFLKHVTGYSLYPLRFATVIGILASSLSFLLGVYFLFDYTTNNNNVEGWITIVLLSVFFNGLILMCVGLIGEYIGRIYLTTTAKPQFVIDQVIAGQGIELPIHNANC